MKFKLNIPERIVLMQILPRENNFVTLKIIRDLNGILGIQENEFKKYGIVQKGDSVNWNEKAIEEIEIEIGERAEDIIIESLKGLNDQKRLEQKHFSLYEKFVEK